MREQVVDLLEKIDLAVAESDGILERAHLDEISRLRNEIRTRLAYPDDVLIVGLVGGTGSGKSSLLNAIAGEELAEIGSIRPTTSEPFALVPEHREESLSGYMNEIGVERLVGSHRDWLCLLDLPDTDSVEASHFATVEQLLPRLDVVVWIVDPEKYRDAAIHAQIAALAGYEDQFVFVLNQRDRLAPDQLEMVLADFVNALGEDGISKPRIFPTAAHPATGPALGIEELEEGLAALQSDQRGVYMKLLQDVNAAASRLSVLADGARSLDFESRWAAATEAAESYLSQGHSAEAAHSIASLLRSMGDDAGDLTATGLRDLGDQVHGLFEEIADPANLLTELENRIAAPTRATLRRRARSHAAITELVLASAN